MTPCDPSVGPGRCHHPDPAQSYIARSPALCPFNASTAWRYRTTWASNSAPTYVVSAVSNMTWRASEKGETQRGGRGGGTAQGSKESIEDVRLHVYTVLLSDSATIIKEIKVTSGDPDILPYVSPPFQQLSSAPAATVSLYMMAFWVTESKNSVVLRILSAS